MPLSRHANASWTRPIHSSFWCSHIRPPAQRDVAGSIFFGAFFFFVFFFSLKKLSQLDAVELARCPWARAMCLSELDGAEPARCSWASSQKLPNVLNCQVQSPLITLVLDMVPLKKPKMTYPWWNWASYMFWASSKRWKIVDSTIQFTGDVNQPYIYIYIWYWMPIFAG